METEAETRDVVTSQGHQEPQQLEEAGSILPQSLRGSLAPRHPDFSVQSPGCGRGKPCCLRHRVYGPTRAASAPKTPPFLHKKKPLCLPRAPFLVGPTS